MEGVDDIGTHCTRWCPEVQERFEGPMKSANAKRETIGDPSCNVANVKSGPGREHYGTANP